MKKTRLFGALAAMILLTLGLNLQAQDNKTSPKTQKAQVEIDENRIRAEKVLRDIDETTDRFSHAVISRNRTRYELVLEGDKVIAMCIDGRKIPADSFRVYDGVVKQLIKQMEEDRKQSRLDRMQAEQDRELAEIDRDQARKDRRQADQERLEAEIERQAIAEKELAERGARISKEKIRRQAELEREQGLEDRKEAELARAQAEKDRRQASQDRLQAEIDRQLAVQDRIRAEEDRAIMKSMISELVKENIVADEKSVRSFYVSDDEMRVNGKDVPEEIRKRIMAKLKTRTGFRMSYNQ